MIKSVVEIRHPWKRWWL